MKSIIITIVSCLLLAAVIIGASYTFSSSNENSNATQKTQVDPSTVQLPEGKKDPRIVSALVEIGYNPSEALELNANLVNADKILEVCNWDSADGCFIPSVTGGDMYIRDAIHGDEFNVLVAHEYLHFIWYKYDLADDASLKTMQRNLYNSDKQVESRISAHYTDIGSDIDTELFSYLCTEFQTKIRNSHIDYVCNKYIDNLQLPI